MQATAKNDNWNIASEISVVLMEYKPLSTFLKTDTYNGRYNNMAPLSMNANFKSILIEMRKPMRHSVN